MKWPRIHLQPFLVPRVADLAKYNIFASLTFKLQNLAKVCTILIHGLFCATIALKNYVKFLQQKIMLQNHLNKHIQVNFGTKH
jgi:hypothetical protein